MREFAEDIDVNYKLVAQSVDKIASLIIKALEDDVVNDLMLLDKEKLFIEKLRVLILQRAKIFKSRASEMPLINY